jgi:hypothetical protein
VKIPWGRDVSESGTRPFFLSANPFVFQKTKENNTIFGENQLPVFSFGNSFGALF